MREKGIFAGQEHLGSLRSKYNWAEPVTGELIDSHSNPVFDFNFPKRQKHQIIFSQGGNEIATLDSQVERITEKKKILFFKAKMLKDRNYITTVNFPRHLPIQIKLCLLMKTAMRAHEIYIIENPKPDDN
ncbi:Oidioi.mRNA.OKI2018_I69.PAR.g10848.t4.cds [Oikopleura dioica]|nr:Oidioi.mRNA.OKI2018_I69.PAR.g10848.t4.cds [Oikopleura dioica]